MDPFAPPPQNPMMGPPMADPMMGGAPMPMAPMMAQPPAPLPEPPDPIEALKSSILAMDPDQLSTFASSLSEKERTLLFDAMEDEPEVLAALLSAIPLSADYEPERPRWFKRPPKPDVDTVIDLAMMDYEYYGALRDRFKADIDVLTTEQSGVFAMDKDDKDKATWKSTAIAAEINLAKSILGAITPAYEVPHLDPSLKDETQVVENALYHWDKQAIRRHANRGNSDLRRDIADMFLLYGRAIARQVLDLDDPDDPWDFVLLDPNTTFPVMGGKHGLKRVTRWYQDTVANIAGDYGVDPKTITRPKGKNKDGDKFDDLKLSSWVTVVEYWDEAWCCVTTNDGRVIKPVTEHKLGEVPFVYQIGGLGLPNFVTDPAVTVTTVASQAPIRLRADDIAKKGVSHIHWLKIQTRQFEAITAKLADALLKSDNPPIWLGMDTFAKAKAPSRMGYRRGKVYTYDSQHESPQIPEYNPAPTTMSMLMSIQGAEKNMVGMPDSAFGTNPQANTSGAALDSLGEGRNDKLAPHLQAMELFYGRLGEQKLRMWRDWGRLVQGRDGRYGVVTIPATRRRSRGPQTMELTPEIIERTGANVMATLTSLRLQNLGALGAAVMQWVQGDIMTRRQAAELRGERNPDEMFEEINFEKAMLDPRAQDLRMLQGLLKRTGEDFPDEEIAKLLATIFAQGMLGQGGGGGGGGGGGMAPPAQPAPGGPPSISAGVNMGNYGMAPGSQGAPVGRPPGTGPTSDFNPVT